ncbi:hypothetical protein BJX99DRAFT_264657 [Aspergillus californicus]
MARLNESTAAAEPIEILKRRFVRQNREIARVNSIQSLRIRSLESEVSHLLSENVSLREQLITLSQEVERFEAAKSLHDGIYDVKTRLDGKLMELNSIVAELGSLPRQYSKATREKAEPLHERRARQPSSIHQANGLDPDESLASEADGRLPVILEDKFYPRRTLEAQELQQLSDNDIDVPGSPLFEGSIAYPSQITVYDEPPAATSAEVMDTSDKVENYTELEHSLPSNLETRRKNKISPATVNEERTRVETTSLLDSKFVRKCGAKRKFSVEDEDSIFESASAEDDGFEFSRPAQSPEKMPSQNDHSPIPRNPQPKVEAINHMQPKRKVLEPKSTNTNALSPTKPSATKSYDHFQSPTRGNENSYPRSGKSGQTHMTKVSLRKSSTAKGSNERSANNDKGETRTELVFDAPPSHDLDREIPATEDTSITRPSRRQRAVVSYAEPSLRDKMRRSTNNFGPAVGDARSRKSTLYIDATQDPDEQRSPTKKARNPGVAGEKNDLVETESLAGQPRRPMNMISHRKRKTSGRLVDSSADEDLERQSRGLGTSVGQSEEEMEQIKQDKLPAILNEGLGSSTNKGQTAAESRKSRRHSSNTNPSGRNIAPRFSTSILNVEVGDDYMAEAHPSYSTGDISLDSTTNDNHPANEIYESSDTSLLGSRETSRGQRIAARRKSMMI